MKYKIILKMTEPTPKIRKTILDNKLLTRAMLVKKKKQVKVDQGGHKDLPKT